MAKENWVSQYEDLRSTFVTGREDYSSLSQPLQDAVQMYRREKLGANQLDFTDATLQSRYLLESNPDLRRGIQEKYPFVQVDEFQDVSAQQYSLLNQLSPNLWAVGDFDQSIMSFRGGGGEAMQDIIQKGAKVYNIEENFRSTPEIVGAAQGFIQANRGRMDIGQTAVKPSGEPVSVVDVGTWMKPNDVIDRITGQIQRGQETAILTRTTRERDRYQTQIAGRLRASGWSQEEVGNLVFETMHASKGREFDHVILPVNLLEKQGASQSGRDVTLPTRHAKTAAELAEEERLFYVGMTRAQDKLTVMGDPYHPYLNRLEGVLEQRKPNYFDEVVETSEEILDTPVERNSWLQKFFESFW